MAKITINIPDGKLSNVCDALLGAVGERPEGVTDVDFVKGILLNQLRTLRKLGKRRLASSAVIVDDSDIS